MKHNDTQTAPQETVLIWAAVSSKAQDKYSVDDQLTLARAWCQQGRSAIVEELVVRGFSRDYWTLADVVSAAANDPDMEAFAKLQSHIRRKDFTTFLCFDADRFGRTASLVQEIIGRITRDCGARIFTLFDNVWMDSDSALMIGTMKAFKAQQDLSRLKEYHVVGMHNRGKNGKSTTSMLPIFQKRIRDDRGKEIAVIVNEDLRRLYTDIATVLLRGTPWRLVEGVLFDEFGHEREGKPLGVDTVRRMVEHFSFWGHAAINYRWKGGEPVQTIGPWIWDEHVPPPPPAVVYRNRYPAVYSGIWADLGEHVKAELWRRYNLRGSARPDFTFRFHGLLVCDECGYSLNRVTTSRDHTYVRCDSHFASKKRFPLCSQSKNTRVEIIQAYFHQQIQAKLKDQPSEIFDEGVNLSTLERSIESTEQQIAKLQKRNENLIDELGDPDTHEISRASIRKRMNENSVEIDRLSPVLDDLQAQLYAYKDTHQAQDKFFSEVGKKGIDWLWEQPDSVIHRGLSAALGMKQIVIRDGEIIGILPATQRIRGQRRRLQ